MKFLIADSFTDSLARLTGDEQKQVKTTAFDLQLNPANPGHRFHKLDRARDKNFWSVRVGSDLRLIVHRSADSLLLCYVDHHDPAYDWAERRKLETHPKTGAAQLIEIRETVRHIEVPQYVQTASLFHGISDDELLGYGVPPEWLADVRLATEDSLLDLADHLPAEAAEALLELATGGTPRIQTASATHPFEHPDAQRRFRVMDSVEELQRALDYPWEKWVVFLHPEQRQWVERDYNGPARVSGSAGTGKTIVALHRAAHLARHNPDSRILLATFTDTLARALQFKLNRLLTAEARLAEQIDAASLTGIARRLYEPTAGPVQLASATEITPLLQDASEAVGTHRFSLAFLLSEWEHVVDAWQLDSWESYRDVVRLGRKTRLSEAQRQILWEIFARVRAGLETRSLLTPAALFTRLATILPTRSAPAFDFAVIDEAQDLAVYHLRFLVALAGGEGTLRPNALFFAGDLGQRIFQQPFSWKSLGVDVRGRARTLRVNYRTSHQIRSQADRLLEAELSDADGNEENRRDTVSVFNGPLPDIRVFKTADEESIAVGQWLAKRVAAGVKPQEFGIFVRSEAQIERALAALAHAALPCQILDERVALDSERASVCTMHLAKGLEFRVVAVMACDEDTIPSSARIESVGEMGDLQEVYDTERHLLYVACTRARDHLLISGSEPASEFLDDMGLAR